jgi:hypothetical protein
VVDCVLKVVDKVKHVHSVEHYHRREVNYEAASMSSQAFCVHKLLGSFVFEEVAYFGDAVDKHHTRDQLTDYHEVKAGLHIEISWMFRRIDSPAEKYRIRVAFEGSADNVQSKHDPVNTTFSFSFNWHRFALNDGRNSLPHMPVLNCEHVVHDRAETLTQTDGTGTPNTEVAFETNNSLIFGVKISTIVYTVVISIEKV